MFLLPLCSRDGTVSVSGRHLGNGVEDDKIKTDMPSVMELGELQQIKSMQGMRGYYPIVWLVFGFLVDLRSSLALEIAT